MNHKSFPYKCLEQNTDEAKMAIHLDKITVNREPFLLLNFCHLQ